MKIEKRKLKYLLKKAHTTMDEVNNRFNKIDKLMQLIEDGQLKTVYEENAYLFECYPKEIVEIIDRDNGIIRTYEKSIDKYEKGCILGYTLKEDILKSFL